MSHNTTKAYIDFKCTASDSIGSTSVNPKVVSGIYNLVKKAIEKDCELVCKNVYIGGTKRLMKPYTVAINTSDPKNIVLSLGSDADPTDGVTHESIIITPTDGVYRATYTYIAS